MANRRDTMPLFSDPQFVAQMDAWYVESGCRKEWKRPINVPLAEFVYWCTRSALQQKIEVNSVVWAGHYGHASDYFEKYMRRTANKKQKFDNGYPFTVERYDYTQEVLVGQWFDDESLWASFPIQHNLSPDEFVSHVRRNLVFGHGDGSGKERPGGDFYEDSLRPEMEQLFIEI